MQDMIEEQVKILAEECAEERAQELAEEMIQDSYNEGANEKAIETAQNFLDNNISVELISKCTGLPLEKVMELKKKLWP